MLMDSQLGAPSPTTPAPPRHPSSTPFPVREDCWTEDSTFTLINSWGNHYLDLNRGSLRQKHWQEVADAVNHRHSVTTGNGNIKKNASRTHVQCKNRIDTLKKKYKIEKARVSDFAGGYESHWPFFSRLDALIGDTYPIKKLSPPITTRSNRSTVTKPPPPAWITSVPVGPRSGTQKRPAIRDEFIFRRNFSAFAAAAAAAAEADSDDSDSLKWSPGTRGRGVREDSEKEGEYGCKELAIAIERFGEIYERVESAKQRQMVELEKQRMQFAKDLEYQRMQLFMETQLQLHKVKRTKRSSGASDSYS
ncbi:PREDICTED: trihelix transcription factor ASIL2-like [Lupinus angustifolius]|uniref:trihelix transcription factor ASIL2-like n=1 Tax=Lupinus angustifolius TaxID=3871 RepID=UPI00092F666C|nr:PREDICTED: trihelix transcription factor ASIL2-like [Lupinus angustifolius]